MAPRSSLAPETKTASLPFCPLLTEITKFAVTKLAWSLVRNGTCRSRISLRATPPSTERVGLEVPDKPGVFIRKGRNHLVRELLMNSRAGGQIGGKSHVADGRRLL